MREGERLFWFWLGTAFGVAGLWMSLSNAGALVLP